MCPTDNPRELLAHVNRLRETVGDRQQFRGYSGAARMAGGLAALATAGVLASPCVPAKPIFHLLGWGALLAFGGALNYGALLRWFLFAPEAGRKLFNLRPALDALPALAAGGILSAGAVLHGHADLLFGIWMCCYGAVHGAYRRNLPPANYAVGVFYLAAGAACLAWPDLSFTNPWPMGLVFFVGESAGGAIFLIDNYKAKQAAGSRSLNPEP
jgi:hypothetical protein